MTKFSDLATVGWVALWAAAACGQEPAARKALPDCFEEPALLWQVELGSHQYTIPRIDEGRVYVGINDARLEHPAAKSSGGGVLMCLEQDTGRMIWQLPVPRYREGVNPPFHFNQWRCGVCSSPALDGDRLYIVGPRGDVLCLDRNGQADGNAGPFVDEKAYMGLDPADEYALTAADGDIIWRYDLIRDLGVVPHDVCGSTPLIWGDFVYVCTSNGMDHTHLTVANPDAPSLIVLDKRTGRLVAQEGEGMGRRILHGNWSSPVAAVVDGQELIVFSGGDGILYAFEPVRKAPPGDRPVDLKKVWQFDCNPPDYRFQDGQPIPYTKVNKKTPGGPSEVVGIPAIYDNRIYVAIGQSPLYGPGQGQLSCLDGRTGRPLWQSRQVERTLCTATIADGLLYIGDYTGRLHCYDALSGEPLWRAELGGPVWCASPVVADGRVFVATERKELVVLRAGRTLELLARSPLRSEAITPALADGVMYLPTQQRLFAIRLGGY